MLELRNAIAAASNSNEMPVTMSMKTCWPSVGVDRKILSVQKDANKRNCVFRMNCPNGKNIK